VSRIEAQHREGGERRLGRLPQRRDNPHFFALSGVAPGRGSEPNGKAHAFKSVAFCSIVPRRAERCDSRRRAFLGRTRKGCLSTPTLQAGR
jgi:hypothetical protein